MLTLRRSAALWLWITLGALGALLGGCGDDTRGTRGARANELPTAVLLVPASVRLGADVVLDGSASSDPDGRVVRYSFSTGAGSQTIITASPQVTVQYDQGGDYIVRLTVEDDDGGRDAVAVTVSVLAASVPGRQPDAGNAADALGDADAASTDALGGSGSFTDR